MELVNNLKWRYAVKKYDASKRVSQQNIDFIKEAVQLSASSYGLQPYEVMEITSPKLRDELRPIAWNQSQITDASHLFLFCHSIQVTKEDVEDIMLLKAHINEIDQEKVAGYGRFVNGKLKEKSETEMFHWTAKQSYIALANAIIACAELKIDCTPIEGFDPIALNNKLGLKEKGLSAGALLAVGYRHPDDSNQDLKKVRKPIDNIFSKI